MFPALQTLIQHGHLDVPIVGVAKAGWNLEQFRARARESLADHGGIDEAAFAKSGRSARVTSTATTTIQRRSSNSARRWASEAPASLPGDTAESVRHRGGTSGPIRLRRGRPSRDREAVRPRPGVRPRAEPNSSRECSRNRASSGSTTTWARSRFLTFCSSDSPTSSSSRSGTATTSRACRSRWPRALASRGAGSFYEEAGAIRDVVQNHMLQVVAMLTMEPPGSNSPDGIRDEKAKVLRAVRPLGPANVVRGQYRGYRQEKGVAPTPRSRRSPR